MAWTVLQLSYYFLAPVSVLAGLVLLVLFALVRELRLQRGWLVLWQCLAQSLLDLHWLSTYHFFSHSQHSVLCQVVGTVSLYSLLLAYNYTAALSYVIIAYLRRPLRSVESSIWGLHAVCHGLAAAGALATLGAGNIGTSIMTTCFIASRTPGEVIMMIPLVVHTPMCLLACGYALRKYRKQYALRQFIWKHMLVVLVFASMWTLPLLLHFLNEGRIQQGEHIDVLMDVSATQLALICGSTSGLMTTIVRLLEPGLIPVILARIRGLLRGEQALSSGSLNEVINPSLRRESTDPIHQNSQEFAWTLLISLHLVLKGDLPRKEKAAGVWKYEVGKEEVQGELGEFVRKSSER